MMKTENIDRTAILAEVNAAFYRYEQALITQNRRIRRAVLA